jgi:hypothetical protein
MPMENCTLRIHFCARADDLDDLIVARFPPTRLAICTIDALFRVYVERVLKLYAGQLLLAGDP